MKRLSKGRVGISRRWLELSPPMGVDSSEPAVRKPIETRLKRLLKRTILRRMTRIAIRKAALMMLKAIVLPRLLKISNSIYLQERKRDMYTRAKEITATLSVMK